MRIHNRFLPEWMHRVANGVLGVLLAATAGASGYLWFAPDSIGEGLSGWFLLLSPVVGLLLVIVNPARFSLVDGIAGEMGYDELETSGHPGDDAPEK